MAVERAEHQGHISETPLSPIPQNSSEALISDQEAKIEAINWYSDLKKILPKVKGFQSAFRSTESKDLQHGVFSFDLNFDNRNYKFHVKHEEGKKLSLSLEFSLSGEQIGLDGQMQDNGPFIKDEISTSPEEGKITYAWSISDNIPQPITPLPNSQEARKRGRGFINFLRSFTI